MRNPTLRSNIAHSLKNMLKKEILLNVRIYQVYLKGTLASYDQYSNITLTDAVELRKDDEGNFVEMAKYENVLVRGDSIVNIGVKI